MLSGLTDIIFARVYGHSDIAEMADEASVPVVKYVFIFQIVSLLSVRIMLLF